MTEKRRVVEESEDYTAQKSLSFKQLDEKY